LEKKFNKNEAIFIMEKFNKGVKEHRMKVNPEERTVELVLEG
jgi:hypothetical protein